jgi:hypothetical protein
LWRDLLEHLHRHGQFRAFWFADQHVHVLRHHDITRDVAAVPGADSLKRPLEGLLSPSNYRRKAKKNRVAVDSRSLERLSDNRTMSYGSESQEAR